MIIKDGQAKLDSRPEVQRALQQAITEQLAANDAKAKQLLVIKHAKVEKREDEEQKPLREKFNHNAKVLRRLRQKSWGILGHYGIEEHSWYTQEMIDRQEEEIAELQPTTIPMDEPYPVEAIGTQIGKPTTLEAAKKALYALETDDEGYEAAAQLVAELEVAEEGKEVAVQGGIGLASIMCVFFVVALVLGLMWGNSMLLIVASFAISFRYVF